MIAFKVLLLREDKQEEADSYPCAPCCSSFLESQGTISMVDGSTKIKKRLVRSKPFSGKHQCLPTCPALSSPAHYPFSYAHSQSAETANGK